MGIWPFSRRSGPDPGRDAGAAGGDPGEWHIPGPQSPESTGEWATLPAVQPSFEPMGLILGARAFEDNLATRRAPQPFLAPLGHDVTADGPTGTVSGIVNPAVQRFATPPPTRFGVLVPDGFPAPTATSPQLAPATGSSEPAVTQRSTLGPDLDLPLRNLPVLDDGGSQPSGGPGTEAGGDSDQTAPAPVADLLGGAPELEAPLQGLWDTPAPAPPLADEGNPGTRTAEAVLSRLSEPGDDRPRRLGLGEPMSAVPSPIQRLLGPLDQDTGSLPPPAPSPTTTPSPETVAPFPVPRLGAAIPGVPSLQRRADRPSGTPATRPDPGAERQGPDVLIFQAPSAPETVVARAAEPSLPAEAPPPPDPPASPPAATVPDAIPVVQREAETTPGPGPEPGASPATPGSVAVGPGGVNLDELAKRLYGRLSSQLRAELRLDRERAGLLSDLGR